ncbi:MAG: hypothetical protein IJD82_00445, partial [Clostridia bacterium]|nr:hypothetical protein [Clostridia bacterium]
MKIEQQRDSTKQEVLYVYHLKMIYLELVNFFLNSRSKKSKTGLKVSLRGSLLITTHKEFDPGSG